MKSHSEIAHRHLLQADGLQSSPCDALQFIRLIIAEPWVSSHAGQLFASCLVNLLVRQVGLIRQIEIVAPSVACVVRLPFSEKSEIFPRCLRQFSTWAVDGEVGVSDARTEISADVTILVGVSSSISMPTEKHVLAVVGEGWRAWIGDPLLVPYGVYPTSTNPLGPFLAAALAAGEIFKLSRGILRGRYLHADGYSLWSGLSSPNWHSLDTGTDTLGSDLDSIHIIGVGAVGNALAYVMAYLDLAHSYPILIDDDRYDKTNLNRCLLAGWGDINKHKVEAVANALRTLGMDSYQFKGSINSYVSDARDGLRADVAEQINSFNFQVVASCVDKRLSRQHIQGLRPRLLLGGSTLNLQAKCNIYNRHPEAACLACYNPAEQDGEKIRALENQLRKMPCEQRARYLEENGLDTKSIEDYLSGVSCGGVGEAALKDFATRLPPQFSAGFVSLASGVLLGAALVRNTIYCASAPQRNDMTTLNFLNGGLIDAGLGTDPSCEFHSFHAILDKC